VSDGTQRIIHLNISSSSKLAGMENNMIFSKISKISDIFDISDIFYTYQIFSIFSFYSIGLGDIN